MKQWICINKDGSDDKIKRRRSQEEIEIDTDAGFRKKMFEYKLDYIFSPPDETQKQRNVQFTRFRRAITRYETNA